MRLVFRNAFKSSFWWAMFWLKEALAAVQFAGGDEVLLLLMAEGAAVKPPLGPVSLAIRSPPRW